MRITNIKIKKVRSRAALGYASIVIDNEFAVNDIAIVEKSNKELDIVMQCRVFRDGRAKAIAHPIKNETREKIKNAILEEYNLMN